MRALRWKPDGYIAASKVRFDHKAFILQRMHQYPPDISVLPPGMNTKALELLPFWDFPATVQNDEKDVLREGNFEPCLILINEQRLKSVETLGFFDSLMVPLVCISGDR